MVYEVAIMGYGGMGNAWHRWIKKHPDFELKYIIDTNSELLEHVEETGVVEEGCAYMTIDDLVAMTSKKPDLVVIATPIYTHHVLTRETMDHGINVMCEKNMASTIYQGRQMVMDALNNPNLCTAVGTNYRYGTAAWTARQFLQQDDCPIGDLSFMRWAQAGNWGEKRRGWRRWIQDVYVEDMCTHWLDLLRYQTGLDIVQVKCDTFIPKYSKWQGSSTVFMNLALAHPDDYNHRHNWVWCQLYGDWQRRGPGYSKFEYFGDKGQAERSAWGIDSKIYQDEDGRKWEEDGYLIMDAGSIEGLDVPYTDQGIILEMFKRGIESNGKKQPGTHFAEAFKSFAVSMAAIESSRTGKTIWVPDYWDGLLE
jgi:predicted dehydrogenase